MSRAQNVDWPCPLCSVTITASKEKSHFREKKTKHLDGHLPLSSDQLDTLSNSGFHVIVCSGACWRGRAHCVVGERGIRRHLAYDKSKSTNGDDSAASDSKADSPSPAPSSGSSSRRYNTRSASRSVSPARVPVVARVVSVRRAAAALPVPAAPIAPAAAAPIPPAPPVPVPNPHPVPAHRPAPARGAAPAPAAAAPAAPRVPLAVGAGPLPITPEDLLSNCGRLSSKVPDWAKPLFLSISNKLLDHALNAKGEGGPAAQALWERRLVNWFAAIASLLARASGGKKRGQRRLRLRFRKLSESIDSEINKTIDHLADSVEGDEFKVGREESKEVEPDERVAARVLHLLHEGFVGKAARAMLHSGAPASFSSDMSEKLREKIPQNDVKEPIPRLPANAPLVIFQADHKLRDYIGKFAAKGSAPGPLQISGRVLSLVVESDVGLRAVAAIMSDLANGNFTSEIRSWFTGSLGVALPKSDGDVRPICIGDVFSRITAAWLVRESITDIRSACGPEQQGQGVSSGCERIVHVLQTCLESESPKLACLKIDIKNAFNTRSRAHCLTSLFKHQSLARLWRLAAWLYAERSPIWFLSRGSIIETLFSIVGVKQGDPLGSVLFDLSIAEVLELASKVDPNVKVLADHDDIFLVGRPQQLQNVFVALTAAAARHGSVVALQKCELLFFHPPELLPVDVSAWLARDQIKLRSDAAIVLGAPIGRDVEAVAELALKIAREDKIFFDRLADLNFLPAQEALLLLRVCGVPRWNYLLRCVRPAAMFLANPLYESMQFEVFCSRTGISMSELTERLKDEVSLPVSKFGGWGLRRPSKVGQLAWFSAQAAAAPLLQEFTQFFGLGVLPLRPAEGKDEKDRPPPDNPDDPRLTATASALQFINSNCTQSQALHDLLPADAADCLSFYSDLLERKNEAKAARSDGKKPLQSLLSKAEESNRLITLLDTCDSVERKFLAARCLPEAHHWKLALPTRWQLKLSDEEIASCARVELGLTPAQSDVMPVSCGHCNKANSALEAVHFITCPVARASSSGKRHNEVVQAVASFCRAVGVHVTVEPMRLADYSQIRPDLDLVVRLQRVLVDVTIRCSQVKSSTAASFQRAHQEKEKKYRNLAQECGAKFTALVFDAFGGWSDLTSKALNDWKFTRRRDSAIQRAFTGFKQEVSVAIHRFNAQALNDGVVFSRRAMGDENVERRAVERRVALAAGRVA
jgi:hypothetical protein